MWGVGVRVFTTIPQGSQKGSFGRESQPCLIRNYFSFAIIKSSSGLPKIARQREPSVCKDGLAQVGIRRVASAFVPRFEAPYLHPKASVQAQPPSRSLG